MIGRIADLSTSTKARNHDMAIGVFSGKYLACLFENLFQLEIIIKVDHKGNPNLKVNARCDVSVIW